MLAVTGGADFRQSIPAYSNVFHSRDADLENVVLDQLLPKHDDAELNAQLNEAASWCTLRGTQQQHLPHTVVVTSHK